MNIYYGLDFFSTAYGCRINSGQSWEVGDDLSGDHHDIGPPSGPLPF